MSTGVLTAAPPQPTTQFYPIDALAMATARTRQPSDPQFNPAFKTKAWVGSGTFQFFDFVAGTFSAQTVSAAENGVNFPPAQFPPYTVAATVATSIAGAPGVGTAIAPYLSAESDAQALMATLGGAGLYDGGAASINYGAETRRVWCFTVAGQPVCAATLLAEQNANGVGAPGTWQGTTWVPTPEPAVPANETDWGLPYRALLPGEKIVVESVGLPNQFQIQNTLFGATAVASPTLAIVVSYLQQIAAGMQPPVSLK